MYTHVSMHLHKEMYVGPNIEMINCTHEIAYMLHPCVFAYIHTEVLSVIRVYLFAHQYVQKHIQTQLHMRMPISQHILVHVHKDKHRHSYKLMCMPMDTAYRCTYTCLRN